MFANLREDLRHYSRYCYQGKPVWRMLPRILYAHPASVAVIWYRFGRAAYAMRIPIVRQMMKLIYLLFFPAVRLYSGVQLLPATSVGPGLAILHFGGVVIAPGSTIGKNCLLHQHCNIVYTQSLHGPMIGDNFYAGAGTMVIGAVTVEDNVSAGAASVITKSVPRDAVVAGVPAKIVRFRQPQENLANNETVPRRPAAWMACPECLNLQSQVRPGAGEDVSTGRL